MTAPQEQGQKPYRVKLEREGCESCGDGKQWEVYDAEDVGIGGMTFGIKEEAKHVAELMNEAYQAGQSALSADLVRLRDELATLRAILDTLISQAWKCGCGHTNGAALATCAQCGRQPGEGSR